MSFSKVMEYEKPKVKKIKTAKVKDSFIELERLSTPKIVWYLIKRHKVGLLWTWAVVMSLLYLLPFLPDVIWSAL